MIDDRERVNVLREKYRPGMRIRLLCMDDLQAPTCGTVGTVVGVDDIGSIMMNWDNVSTLSLIPDIDEFEIVNIPEGHK